VADLRRQVFEADVVLAQAPRTAFPTVDPLMIRETLALMRRLGAAPPRRATGHAGATSDAKRSASAVMVRLGLTPTLAATADPSTT
jgi:hypothetical protein